MIVETLHLPSECSLQREGVQTMAKLLTDPRQKVLASASSVLRILAGQHKQREQVTDERTPIKKHWPLPHRMHTVYTSNSFGLGVLKTVVCCTLLLQALVNCLEMLEDDEVDTRVCGCKALACLKVSLPNFSERLHPDKRRFYETDCPRLLVQECSYSTRI